MRIESLTRFLCVTAVLLLGIAPSNYGQDDTVRVETDLVNIPVSVLDKDGRYISGLKKDQFRLVENGIEQKISFFEPTEAPFTVMLLADVSGSMSRYMPALGRAIDAFISQLRPDDTFLVAFFSAESRIITRIPPVKKKDYRYVEPPPRVNRSFGSSFTMTLDAVDDAMKYMRKFDGRRAIILFGDGDQSGGRRQRKAIYGMQKNRRLFSTRSDMENSPPPVSKIM